jgi:hypothetical protein
MVPRRPLTRDQQVLTDKVRRTLNFLKGAFPSETPPVRFWLLSFSGPVVLTYSLIFLNHSRHPSPALFTSGTIQR